MHVVYETLPHINMNFYLYFGHFGYLGRSVETVTSQIECMDSLGSWIQSQLMSKLYKCCSMLCEVFFSLFERQLWGCALNWSLATQKIPNPSEARGSFFEKDYIHTEDSSTSPFLLISVCKFECVSEFLTFLKKFI